MAIRNIVKVGDEILTKKCRPVTKYDERLHELIDDMMETMKSADGVGLAACQVGILRRIVTIDIGEGPVALVNPEIVEESGEQRAVEGCLSCPGQYGYTLRPMKVKAKAQDRDGNWFEIEGEALIARAICHELDHLDGVMFLEHVVEFLEADNSDDDQGEEAEKI